MPLQSYYNNKGFGQSPGEAAINSLNESYPDPSFATVNGTYTSHQSGIVYSLPGYQKDGFDNVICSGQTIDIPPDEYFSVSMLVASDVFGTTVSGNVTYNYTDSSENTVSELRALPWWATLTINRGEIIFPYRYTANRTDFNTSHIFEYTAALLPGKKLNSITLPSTTNATTGRLHVFAISLWRGSSKPSSNLPSASAEIQFVRPTQKWVGDGYQVVEVTVNNPGTVCISNEGLNVSISESGVRTVQPGLIRRLCPGDQKRVDVAVSGSSNGTLTVMLEYDGLVSRHTISHIELGLTEWTSDYDSISRHESPQWFDDDKYGIFIHWGPYSVPGWGNSTPYETYAEWFWYISLSFKHRI